MDETLQFDIKNLAIEIIEPVAPDPSTRELVDSVHGMPDSAEADKKDDHDYENEADAVLNRPFSPIVLSTVQIPESQEYSCAPERVATGIPIFEGAF
jgi:hypothetical protein